MKYFEYFEDLGVELKEEEDNKVFPVSGKARDILDAMVSDLKSSGVDIHHEEVINVTKEKYDFIVNTNVQKYTCKHLVIATGGLTYPKLGSTGVGYDVGKTFNHIIIDTFPTNTPLVSNDKFIQDKALQGISMKNVDLKYNKTKYSGAFIFTHFGISGPIVLNISKHVHYGLKKGPVELRIDLLPEIKREYLTERIKEEESVAAVLRGLLPKRFVDFIIKETNTSQNLSEISKDRMNKMIEMVKNFKIIINSTKGYDHAIVTGGGVSIEDIDTKTMESKCVYNLYFVGEVLDLDGKTGGYNLTIALSTGHAAGLSI